MKFSYPSIWLLGVSYYSQNVCHVQCYMYLISEVELKMCAVVLKKFEVLILWIKFCSCINYNLSIILLLRLRLVFKSYYMPYQLPGIINILIYVS